MLDFILRIISYKYFYADKPKRINLIKSTLTPFNFN